jgi:hypothetical protein
VDLRDAAVLGAAEPADERDDVEAEFVPRQGDPALSLGAEGDVVAPAIGGAAAPDQDGQADQAVEGGDDAVALVGGSERPAAAGAGLGQGRQVDLSGREVRRAIGKLPGQDAPQGETKDGYRSSRLCRPRKKVAEGRLTLYYLDEWGSRRPCRPAVAGLCPGSARG